jgi:hypothetical protein
VNKKVSGMLFFREAGEIEEGRKLMMVVGILAIPGDGAEVKGEHQAIITGEKVNDCLWLTALCGPHMVDRTEEGKDEALGSLLLQPIWRH